MTYAQHLVAFAMALVIATCIGLLLVKPPLAKTYRDCHHQGGAMVETSKGNVCLREWRF